MKTNWRKSVRRIAAALSDNGVWLLADFAVPDRGLGRAFAQFLIALMYRFFRIFAGLQAKQLIDPTPSLLANRLKCTDRAISLGGVLKSERWQKEGYGQNEWNRAPASFVRPA